MRILVTTPGKLIRSKGHYYTKIIYGYEYFSKYLGAFDEVVKIGQCSEDNLTDTSRLLQVDGKGVDIFELPKTSGAIDYFRKKKDIEKLALTALKSCDAAALRIPDPLSFFLIEQCCKLRKPFVVEITTDIWTYLAPQNSTMRFGLFFRYYWHYLQKQACLKANGVSYVTQYHLQSRYPSYISLHPADQKHFEAAFTDADIPLNQFRQSPKNEFFKDGKIKLVHISGNLSFDGKGYKELLEALNILSKTYDIELGLVGDGELSPANLQYVRDNNLLSFIHKYGKVETRERMFDILNDSDIFVFPSYTEGLPRVVVEAMACGLPCVGSDIPGNRELMQNDALVAVHNGSALASKLDELIRNVELLRVYSVDNLLKAKKEFSKEAVNKKSQEFYQRLANIFESSI